MSQITQTVESRRKELIDQLAMMGVYKHGDKHLFGECKLNRVSERAYGV